MFSPYYHWSGRRDPDNHVCINVALYAPGGNRWTMTERGRPSLHRTATLFRAGPSALAWDGQKLSIDLDEIAVPRPPAQWLPKRVRGSIELTPRIVTEHVFDIDATGRHRWWPIAPSGPIAVEMEGGPRWSGHGYLDCNWGTGPLETAFARWDWARGDLGDGRSVILYDTQRLDGSAHCLAITIDGQGTCTPFDPPPATALPRGFWGVRRFAHHDRGQDIPGVLKTLEDGPFYMRSVVRTRLLGRDVDLMHESLSGTRFASPLVKLMLPFRMPRRA